MDRLSRILDLLKEPFADDLNDDELSRFRFTWTLIRAFRQSCIGLISEIEIWTDVADRVGRPFVDPDEKRLPCVLCQGSDERFARRNQAGLGDTDSLPASCSTRFGGVRCRDSPWRPTAVPRTAIPQRGR